MPSPNEMQVLRLAKELGEINKAMVARRMQISTEYSNYLLNHLMGKGYLTWTSPGRYRLTRKGAEALLSVLLQLQGKLAARIRLERWLEKRASEKIAGLSDFIEEGSLGKEGRT